MFLRQRLHKEKEKIMVKISPSILSSDYGKLSSELKRMEDCGADMLHIDVMDGHFVPNITLGAPIVKCIRKSSSLPFDVHLMISDPYKYIPDFVKAGSDIITFHVESDSDIEKTIDLILASGKKAGLSVKPKTPIETVYPYLDKLSMVLVMTVEPGFGGQSFMEDMMPKVSAVKAEIERKGLDIDIQVDGGINKDTISVAAKAGANVFVSGNAIFSSDDAAKTIADFKAKASV
jgi:ribulose-phosphate 3-epimerase